MALRTALPDVRWALLVPALVLTSVLPLTIHVLMLDAGIPHPGPVSQVGLIAWTNDFFTAWGMLIVLRLVGADLSRRPFTVRAVTFILLVAGMTGHVLRDPFMNIINTDKPLVSLSSAGILLDNVMDILSLCLTVLLCTAVSRAGAAEGLRALVVSLVVWLTVGWVLNPLVEPAVAWLDAREGGAIEMPPYDARIQIPAYATFLENGLCAVILVMLVWRRLPLRPLRRVGAASGIVWLLIGPVARPAIDGLRSSDHWRAFLGPLQFSLETLALGALAALTCLACLREAGLGALSPAMSRGGAPGLPGFPDGG